MIIIVIGRHRGSAASARANVSTAACVFGTPQYDVEKSIEAPNVHSSLAYTIQNRDNPAIENTRTHSQQHTHAHTVFESPKKNRVINE